MNILLIWPEQPHEFFLDETCTADNPLYFDVVRGLFLTDEPEESETIAFYWRHACPVIVNRCRDYICIVDGITLTNGEVRPLREKSKIQAGNYRFITLFSDAAETENSTRYLPPASIEEILPRNGYHTLATESLPHSESGEQGEENILRQLELEYKSWLVMGEHAPPATVKPVQQPRMIFCDDERFAKMQEYMNNRTLTECLFASSALIGKVFAELNVALTPEDFQPVEEPCDLLSALAPENYVRARKKSISSLLCQNFYHPGLDSQF